MKDMTTPHKRMQDLCDCFAETDPLAEMASLQRDTDKEEAALKWLALAVLHGIDRHAKKISIRKYTDGTVKTEAEYMVSELPSPGAEIGGRIIEAARAVTHIEGKKGETPLAVGIRDSSIELLVKVSKDSDCEKVTLEFAK
jgi:hypothetical protein